MLVISVPYYAFWLLDGHIAVESPWWKIAASDVPVGEPMLARGDVAAAVLCTPSSYVAIW